MYCVCEEHLSRAIDVFLEEYEDAPDVYKLDQLNFTEWHSPDTCEYCKDRPIYLIV